MPNGFGDFANALGQRVKPYLPHICGIIKWRLNDKSAKVRQQAADLISRISIVMKQVRRSSLLVTLVLCCMSAWERSILRC
jgi:splicing factor 3B subunit 1